MISSKRSTIAIINGNIWTGEKDQPKIEAIFIEEDLITTIGNNDEIKKLIKDDTTVIDAKNNFITPGFIDSHIHFLMGGERLNSVSLKNCKSKEEFIQTIGNYAKTLQKGAWITGGDWDHINWGGELPERFWIDDVTLENPVWLGRHEGHTYLANSLALKITGLLDSDDIPEIKGGCIEKNSEGKITGIFKDNALKLVFTKMPHYNEEEVTKLLHSSMKFVSNHGVTSIHHMTEPLDRNRGGNPNDLEIFMKHENQLETRIYCAVPIQFWKELANKIKNEKNNSKMLRYGALKGYVDGSIGSHSAAMFEDFIDTPGYNGTMVNTSEDLFEWIKEADKEDLQIFIHAIGNRGINTILNIFERVINVNGKKDRRWRIEHSQHILPKDIPRFKELGVIASIQPYHAIEDGRFLEKILSKEELKGTYAFRSLLDAGVNIAFGSDWFVAPPIPLLTIDAAVNRMIDGIPFMPEERITVEESLYASTLWAAYSIHEEHIKGSIKPGKYADIVIMNQDLLKVDKLKIKETEVLMTIVGGKIIYDNLIN